MDTNALIREARARFQHQESKVYLQEKYQAQLTIVNQGGMWTITPELIGYLRSCPDETTIMIDNYKKPIKVVVSEILEDFENTYQEVMESWYEEFEQLRGKR